MTGICTTPLRPRLGRDGVAGRLQAPLTRNDLNLTHIAPSWAKLNTGGRGSTILTVRMFMSDDNYRKPSSPRATRIGLGLSATDASYRANSGLAEVESDTRYMDPPSETHGVEREEIVRRLREDTEASSARAATGHHGLFSSTLRAQTVQRAPVNADDDVEPPAETGDPGLFRTALDNTVRAQPVAAQPISTRPPPPPAPSRAPEAWRDEVRRMVERAPSKGPTSSPAGTSNPSSQSPGGMGGYGGPNAPGGSSLPPVPANKPSLRLKLDADAAEESAYRAPKSALPKVLMWLVILGAIGGGFWLYAESRGGVDALLQQLQGTQPVVVTPAAGPAAAPVAADPAVAPQQPPAAAAPAAAAPAVAAPAAPAVAAPAQPQQPAASAQPSTNTPAPRAAAPSGNASPTTVTAAPSGTPAPSTPKAQPQSAAAPPPEKTGEPAPVAAPKPAAPKAPARQVRPQQPVVKVRPIESAPGTSEPAPSGAAEPLDIPYVPLPGDPPAPDEAR
jgi:hypothetical protein